MTTEFYFDESDFYPYRPISRWYMVVYMLSSAAFFHLCNEQIHVNCPDRKTRWVKKNTILSFIHSTLSSVLLIIAVLRAPEMFEDPLSHSNHFNYALLSFSVGYFLYDFVECLQNSTTAIFPIIAHHVIVVSFFVHILYHTRNVGYALYGLSLELNSFFLHARRLLRWYSPMFRSVRQRQLLKIGIEIGNYVTFIVLRFGVCCFSLCQLYLYAPRLHPVVWTYTALSTVAMGIFNSILFYRLVKNQLRSEKKEKNEDQTDDGVLLVNNHILLPS